MSDVTQQTTPTADQSDTPLFLSEAKRARKRERNEGSWERNVRKEKIKTQVKLIQHLLVKLRMPECLEMVVAKLEKKCHTKINAEQREATFCMNFGDCAVIPSKGNLFVILFQNIK